MAQRLTIEQTSVPRGSGNNPNGGSRDLRYKIKEWGYIFGSKKEAVEYAKTHIETNQNGINGEIIEKKNPKMLRWEN